ncbi:MAG: lipooligosaccharide transport system permease protein [Candidatus Binatota bacterium]|jgi:lipooligosaccharide transport system permease protein|nr:lipooligosaccharide transport system permease protein [Candidatus Binatota bacterium]
MDFRPPRPSRRSVAVWRRNALVWRKLWVPSLLGNFGDPLLYLLGIGYGLGGFIGQVNGMPYVSFFASGLVCANAMNTATFEALYSAFTRMAMQKTWDGMLAAPLLLDDVVLGEIGWAATKSLLTGSIILAVAAALGAIGGVGMLAVPPLIFLTGLCFGSIALVVTVVSPSYDFFLYYFTLAVTPMFLFCGVFFPLSSLPAGARWVTSALPLTHAVELMRPLLTGSVPEHAFRNVAVLATYAVVFGYLAVVLARRRMIT